ncbi:hypothetical protein [Nocardia beijingensis]|nr:hypothetical protein [Nocardia beijingensis]MBF6078511.1 hypothetical protein [Nocardia beijingensis]
MAFDQFLLAAGQAVTYVPGRVVDTMQVSLPNVPAIIDSAGWPAHPQ